ncbi:hypothetical protein DPX16_17820 [Anabarilius grahami]|uniref:Uncharacterized protein n=1 Tax=Anabarilius grahami TaxID=495550 RepID=A0A3N0YHX1_ANAGA|nr:hypothetical protein DPX16_17820 [Anabarilius grahami]
MCACECVCGCVQATWIISGSSCHSSLSPPAAHSLTPLNTHLILISLSDRCLECVHGCLVCSCLESLLFVASSRLFVFVSRCSSGSWNHLTTTLHVTTPLHQRIIPVPASTEVCTSLVLPLLLLVINKRRYLHLLPVFNHDNKLELKQHPGQATHAKTSLPVMSQYLTAFAL